jgi:anti-sigma-K factor RskA
VSNCDQFRELYEAFALGALDAADRIELEKHLATGCAECTQGVAEARWVVSQLAYLSPDSTPSDMLKGRLMQTVRAEAKGSASSGAATAAATDVKTAIPWWMWAGVAALLLVTIGSVWNAQRLRSELTARDRNLAEMQQGYTDEQKQVRAMESQIVAMQQETAIVSNPATHKFMMDPQKIAAPQLVAMWDKQNGVMISGSKIPMPAENHVLQLWMIPKDPAGKPVPSVMIRPDAKGRLVMLISNPPDPSPYKALAITEEPAGGSPQPTSAPRWVGAMT